MRWVIGDSKPKEETTRAHIGRSRSVHALAAQRVMPPFAKNDDWEEDDYEEDDLTDYVSTTLAASSPRWRRAGSSVSSTDTRAHVAPTRCLEPR
jgi:hypothetical protein